LLASSSGGASVIVRRRLSLSALLSLDGRLIAGPSTNNSASTPQVVASYLNTASLDRAGDDESNDFSVVKDDGVGDKVCGKDDNALSSPSSVALSRLPAAAVPGYIIPTMSSYKRMVMDSFPFDDGRVNSVKDSAVYANAYNNADPNVSNVIHPDWIEPLLSLTKSLSPLLVRQLSTRTLCPMRYNAHANLISPQRRSAGAASAAAAPTPLLSYIRR
jgi:hypothetical protein